MTESVSYSIPRIVVSGLRGGSGKTILSLCLVALLRKKGLTVTPFKKGPDYIDAGWLAKAAGVSCYNLDLFMMSPEQALQSFIEHTSQICARKKFTNDNKSTEASFPRKRESRELKDWIPGQARNDGMKNTTISSTHIAVIEGNRGLYDGVDHEGTYSTAELAKLLNAPVILIVDCTKATNTVAAMVLGCQKMDEKVPIGGVVLNRVATARQESVIRKAINERCGLPVVGVIPRLKNDPFPERHMGLTPFQETKGVEESLALVAEIGEKYIDIDSVLKIANEVAPLGIFTNPQPPTPNPASVKIGIIRDSAFQFYYQENFEELEKRGASLIEVSPLRETKLPDIDALYIGGGFPETHAIALAENVGFRNALYSAIQNGLPVYAECGGLMYLGKGLILDNKTYPMVGALPVVFDLERRPHAHGYTIVEVEKTNPFYQVGTVLKGHEFHYSRVIEIEKDKIHFAFRMKRGKGVVDNEDGLCYKNVFATYTHLHAIGAPEWADGLIKCAVKFCADRK
ncbi:MAG: cobyrinate a,c-diamide synthase [Nitrospirae bacterium]|nr:cobyrinate a,c-diamide synthase [Nitrospirota bacterium]